MQSHGPCMLKKNNTKLSYEYNAFKSYYFIVYEQEQQKLQQTKQKDILTIFTLQRRRGRLTILKSQ